MAIRVLLADDSEIMRKAVARLLERDSEIKLVAEATSFSQTAQLMDTMRPQIVILDMHMDDERSVTPSDITSRLNGARLLAISFWDNDETKALARSFGAAALLNKMNLSAELIPAIKLYADEWRSYGAS